MSALIFFFLFIPFSAGSNTVIEGTVTDNSGTPIPGANIYLKGTYEGTSSESNGNFSITTSLEGNYVLVVQALGFKTFETDVEVGSGDFSIDITLRETVSAMSAVTITAGVMEASDENRAVILRPLDIATNPGAQNDVVGAFQTLPGTSTVANDGRLFVRGGDASESSIYIDGMNVGNAFGTSAPNVPTRTRFNPNLFSGSFFSTGGYSAEYGQALSSVLVLNTVDNPVRTQTDISMMSLGGGVSHTQKWDDSSINARVNYFDLQPTHNIVPQNLDWKRSPRSWDTEFSGRHTLGNNTLVKGYLYTEQGDMALRGDGQQPDLTDIKDRYTYGQSSFRHLGSDVIYSGGFSYSANTNRYRIDEIDLKTSEHLYHAKFVIDNLFTDRFTLKSGVESFINDYREDFRSVNFSRDFQENQYHIFSEADFIFSNSLVARAGLRASRSTLSDQNTINPRVSLAYELPRETGQISLAAGSFHQTSEPDFRIIEQDLKQSESQHVILNYMLSRNSRTLRAEIFYKNYDKLLTYTGTRFQYENLQLDGSGRARGFDLFYRDQESLRNTEFWISYSLIDSERHYAHYSSPVQPNFAPTHNGTAVVKYFINNLKSQVGISVSANDGYRYTDPNKPGEMNSTTKAYANLNMNWSYIYRPNVIFHLSTSNITGRDNVFGYEFSPSEETGGFEAIPIQQAAPRFIMLGVFITFSSDKNANQLNNL